MRAEVVCAKCEERQPFSFHSLACHRCGGPLDMAGDTSTTGSRSVSLGEGNTPIIQLEKIGQALGLKGLFAKLDFLNPTGSFKDRGSAALVSALNEQDIRWVAEDSSGNAGASIAAYCAKAGIHATIFAPSSASPAKLAQIAFYGAAVEKIEGGRRAVAQACENYCQKTSVVYASHNLSPLFIEGTKSFAYETAAWMRPSPDHILFPVGNGSLLIGTWKGYQDLRKAGDVEKLPKLHCIQANECMPIVAASLGKIWTPGAQGISSVAGGILVDRPSRLLQVLAALEDTGGKAKAVSEEEIIFWQRRLSQDEGIFVEPTSGAALAGLEALLTEGHIRPRDRVLIALTGFGFKDQIPGSQPPQPASS